MKGGICLNCLNIFVCLLHRLSNYMDENFDYISEEESVALNRYQDMLKNNTSYYFDVYELEHIIDYFLNTDDFKSAKDVIEYSLKMHPGATSIMLKNAQVLINDGLHYKSLKVLDSLSQIESSNSEVFFLKGVVYSSLGELNRALAEFDRAVYLSYEDKDELLVNIASTLQQIGQYDFSINYYRQAYDIDRENSTVVFELAYCHEKLNNDEESIHFYKRYLSLDPFSKLAWYNLANVYHKIERFDMAIEALEFVLAIDPEYHIALYQKGLNEVFNQDYEEGIKSFTEYLEVEKDSSTAYFHIGEAYAKQDKNKEALIFFERALKLDNTYADAYYGEAYIYYSSKKYTDAYYVIKKALKIDSEDSDFWHLSALINQKLGFINEAEKAFKTALDLENSDPQLWIDYSKLQNGNKNLFKSINILSEAYEHFHDNAEINYRLAANLALISNVDSAVYHLKMALQEEPDKLEIFRAIYSVRNSVIDKLIENHGFEQSSHESNN